MTISNTELLIGKNLQYLRSQNNFSQKEMAKFVDLPFWKINAIESFKSKPRIEDLIKICDCFKVSIDSFVREDFNENFSILMKKNYQGMLQITNYETNFT